MVIYRIDSKFNGNADYDNKTKFDEVFISTNSPSYRYFPSYGSTTSLILRNGNSAGITINDFIYAGNKISFNVQLTSSKMAKYFKDYRVAEAISNKIGKDINNITDNDLSTITELIIPTINKFDLSINLEGINKLTNLQKLTANGCKIDDISYLSGLTKLTELRLNDNNITGIDALMNLTSLKVLMLRGNLISDYSPVGGYYNGLTTKDFSLSNFGDIVFRAADYNIDGQIGTVNASLSSTIPTKIYLKFEKYSSKGVLIKEVLSGYTSLYGNSVKIIVPSGMDCKNGSYVVISGYERADYKRLASRLIINPVDFNF